MAQPLLALNRHVEARGALDRFIKTVPVVSGRPPTPGQASELGDALRTRGQVLEEEARACRARGLLSLADGNTRAALEAYSRGLGLVRDHETLTLRGWTYVAANAPDLALADFEESLRLRPASSDALLGRASVRVGLSEPVPALADIEAALKLSPVDARTYFHAARVHAMAVPMLPDPLVGNESLRRATDLLGKALELTEPENRTRFWSEQIAVDRAFDVLRRTGQLTGLDAKYGAPKR